MKARNVALATALLLLAGCIGETLTGVQDQVPSLTGTTTSGTAKNAVKMVPYKGTITGAPQAQRPHPDCPGATVIRTSGGGTGLGTQIGSYTWEGWHCFDYAALVFYDGHITSVAANGDELHIEYHGALTGPNTWVEWDTIVGGTGRFENATGWADLVGESVDTAEGSLWNIAYNGMISSVGSSR